MTDLLPCGGVPRVHGAQSPVPPRLPHFATPRSVLHLATVVAGAYPVRLPPNARTPGVPAPPGPCYWLVASGTPLGWRGGCLDVGLVRGTVCHYCLGGCSALVVCARRSRQVRGFGAGAGSCVSPMPPFLSPRSPRCLWQIAPSECPYPRPPVRHSMRSVLYAGSVRLPTRFARRALCVCVRSRSRGIRAPPPSPGRCGARTTRGSGAGHWWGRSMPVVPLRVSCPVWCAVWLAQGGLGAAQSRSRRSWFWVVSPLVGGPVRPGRSSARGVGAGGGLCASLPQRRGWGAPGGGEQEVAVPWSVPLPPLGGHQKGLHWRRSAHGGCGLHTDPGCPGAPARDCRPV